MRRTFAGLGVRCHHRNMMISVASLTTTRCLCASDRGRNRLSPVMTAHPAGCEPRPTSPNESRAVMPTQPVREPNRWAVLALLSVAELMVVLAATIVTVALPSAQRALHFSNDSRQWVVTAYALAFGSLLLVGGKVGDLFGRKWALIVGLVGFSAASAVGGAASAGGRRRGSSVRCWPHRPYRS